jgi:hypothetical protein
MLKYFNISGLPNAYLGIKCKFLTKKNSTYKMKNLLSFLAVATFVVALSSCGSKPAETTETMVDSTAAAVVEEAAAVVDSAAAVVDSAAAVVDSAAAAH